MRRAVNPISTMLAARILKLVRAQEKVIKRPGWVFQNPKQKAINFSAFQSRNERPGKTILVLSGTELTGFFV